MGELKNETDINIVVRINKFIDNSEYDEPPTYDISIKMIDSTYGNKKYFMLDGIDAEEVSDYGLVIINSEDPDSATVEIDDIFLLLEELYAIVFQS